MTYFSKRAEHFAVSRKEPVADFPRNSLIELSNACNHACVFCHNPFMRRTAGILKKDLFKRFIDEAVSLGLEEVGLYSTGEPFIVKNLSWYIRVAKEAGAKRVYLTTNGVLATLPRVIDAVESGLDSLKFSINASTRKSYKVTHGRDEFDLVVSNVEAIHAWKMQSAARLQLLGSFIYTKLTKGEIDLHKEVFSKYLEEIVYLPAQSQGGRTGERTKAIIDPPSYPDLASLRPCEMLWNRIHMTWEGFLSACCVDYEHDLVFADYRSGEPLAELWNNELMQSLRRKHLTKRLDGLICKSCMLGEIAPYEPISDIQGSFSARSKAESDTTSRIRIALREINPSS